MTNYRKTILNILRFSIPALLTLLWLGFIFGNSLQTGVESGAASGRVHRLVNALPELLGLGSPISEKFVRKAAHFTEFAILGVLVCADLWAYSAVALTRKLHVCAPILLCSVPICALCAAADEFLQSFVDGRGPLVIDVLIDTSGALSATILFIAFFAFIHYLHQKHLRNNTIEESERLNI